MNKKYRVTTVTITGRGKTQRSYYFGAYHKAIEAAAFFLTIHDPEKQKRTGSLRRDGKVQVWDGPQVSAEVYVEFLEALDHYKLIGE